jgi:hypothetical protein
MNIDTLIASDLKALGADTEQRLPSVADTARWLEAARARPRSSAQRGSRRASCALARARARGLASS